jgi:hypothetical protein
VSFGALVARIDPRWWLAALTIMGIVVRLVWLADHPAAAKSGGETHNVAIAFSQTGSIADAFRPGQGPTAHVTPLSPMLAGTVYRLAGIDTPRADAILTGWAMALTFGGLALFYRAFGRLGAPTAGRVVAFGVAALLPMNNIYYETVAFRTWEGGLAVFIAALFLDNLLRLDAAPRVGSRDVLGMGLLAALCLFVSPPLGVAAYLGGLLLMLRRLPPARWPQAALVVGLTASVVLGPWLVRNTVVMDRAIVLRDNLGLEMAQAFHDGAATTANPFKTFWARHAQIHPYGSHVDAYAAMQAAGGEAAYSEALGAGAWRWIDANRRAAAGLMLRNLGAMFFPPAWMWDPEPPPETTARGKALLQGGIAALALLAIAAGLIRVGAGYAYAGLFAVLPALPYALAYPDFRYRYLISTLLLFLACDIIARASRPGSRVKAPAAGGAFLTRLPVR